MHDNTLYFPSLSSTTAEEISWETVTTIIRGGQIRERTEQYRKALADSNKEMQKAIKVSCPCIICQARVKGGRSKEHITGYTGIFMVDFDHVPAERMDEAYRLIKEDKHTLLAYITLSGQGLRAIARVEDAVTEKNYKAAWLTVNEYYKKLTGLDYDRQCITRTRVCGLAHDPDAQFRPVPKRFKIAKSLDAVTNIRTGSTKGRPILARNIARTVRQKVEQDGAEYADGRHNDYISRCIYQMNRYGVAANDCAQWAEEEFADYNATHPKSIAGMVRSIYLNHADEHAALKGRRKPTIAEIEDYISKRFRIRLNQLSFQLEYAVAEDPADSCDPASPPAPQEYKMVDDRFVNSLWRDMEKQGMNVDTKVLNNILGSDFVESYNPFTAWINSLPEWDGKTDYIRLFFSMVHCKDTSDGDFHFYTRCWFLAMVASAINPEVVNHEILTFIGEQGTYKSSFMYNILPPHLRNYYNTKNNWFMLNKDDYSMLAENVILALEEIDSMSTKEINQLKAFTTEPHVKQRPPYGRHNVLRPRVASLCATGNNLTFLSDHTGNRRWLPFHISHIDNPWTARIPYEGMYAQALALLRSGEQYWLSSEQIKKLNKRNEAFLVPNPAIEMIVTFFTYPRSEAETKYMTATKIAARLMPHIKISPTQIGIALSQLGFEQVHTKHGRFWKVAERPGCEIDSRLPGDVTDPMPF